MSTMVTAEMAAWLSFLQVRVWDNRDKRYGPVAFVTSSREKKKKKKSALLISQPANGMTQTPDMGGSFLPCDVY